MRPAAGSTILVEPRPQGEDAVQLLHDIDIIQSLRAAYAPADVFKAAGHVLLPVEVVGVKFAPRRAAME